MKVVRFIGWSGAGKTTLIEKTLVLLKARGVRAAVLKHDGHDFTPDVPGKDSYRFTQAGAEATLITSPERTALTENRPLTLAQALARVKDADVALVEGWKDEKTGVLIGVSRRASGKGLVHPAEEYDALVTDEDVKTGRPVFRPEDIEGLVDFIMEEKRDFNHFDSAGRARMVDVGDKPVTRRRATGGARVLVNRETFALIRSGGVKKGDVLTVAQVAGILGAKWTGAVIPMCHPVTFDGASVCATLDEERQCVDIEAMVTCEGKTGVEMEALTAAATAALTVYDMCKAVQRDMVITDLRLLSKSGGVHGDFVREEEA